MNLFLDKFLYDKRFIRVGFFLLLLASILFIYRDFILLRGYYMYVDIGSDTFMQFYPYYTSLALDIKNGSLSSWVWDYGVGSNVLVPLRLLDPFSLAIAILAGIIGVGHLPYMLIWMQVIKIIIAFFLAWKYFSFFLKNEIAIGFSAYIYALSGYMLLWGQHYYLGTNCIYFILLLCAVENFIRNDYKKGGVFIALSIALCLLFAYYIGYMVLLGGGIYFLYRFICDIDGVKCIKLKDNLIKLGSTAFYVLDGILISCVMFIPSVTNILKNTSRMSHGDGSIVSDFLSSFSLDEVGIRLSRLISSNMLGINETAPFGINNYYEAPQLFCTMFIMFFFGLWIVSEFRLSRKKGSFVSLIVRLILMYLLIFNNAASQVLSAFTGISYRNQFLALPFLCLMVGVVIDRCLEKERISYLGLLIGAILTVIGWGYSYINCSEEVAGFVKKISLFIAFGFILLVLARVSKKYTKLILCVFLLYACMTSVIEGYYETTHRAYISKAEYKLNWTKDGVDNDTTRVISRLKEEDPSIYRIEKTYFDWYLMADSYIEKYSTSEWYQSTQNKNIVEFYDKIYQNNGLSGAGMEVFRMDGPLDIKALSILNSKYILSKENIDRPELNFLFTEGEVNAYRNNKTDQIAKFYPSTITKNKYESLDTDRKLLTLESSVVTDDFELEGNSDARIGEFVLDGPSTIVGNIEASGNGIIMISVASEDGWDIYCDGNKLDRINCDYGFIGAAIEKGTHNIRVEYSIPYLKLGVFISILGVILLIITFIPRKNVEKTH